MPARCSRLAECALTRWGLKGFFGGVFSGGKTPKLQPRPPRAQRQKTLDESRNVVGFRSSSLGHLRAHMRSRRTQAARRGQSSRPSTHLCSCGTTASLTRLQGSGVEGCRGSGVLRGLLGLVMFASLVCLVYLVLKQTLHPPAHHEGPSKQKLHRQWGLGFMV